MTTTTKMSAIPTTTTQLIYSFAKHTVHKDHDFSKPFEWVTVRHYGESPIINGTAPSHSTLCYSAEQIFGGYIYENWDRSVCASLSAHRSTQIDDVVSLGDYSVFCLDCVSANATLCIDRYFKLECFLIGMRFWFDLDLILIGFFLFRVIFN